MVNVFNILNQNNCILFIQDDLDTMIQEDISHYFITEALLYLQIDEKIRYSNHGKPFLQDSFIYFNISHTNNIWVAAFSLSPIGIDIESVLNTSLIDNLDTMLGIHSLQDWCAKEAIVKYLDVDLDAMMLIKTIQAHTQYQYNDEYIDTINIYDAEKYEGFIACAIAPNHIEIIKNKLGLQNKNDSQ
jgi:phosphopantetheinyl transferase